MRIETSGYIAKGLHVIGPAGAPVYLVDGQRPVLFDSGMTVFARLYVQQIQAVLEERTPAFLFITHAHFDHVGAACFFKSTWPDLQVVASDRCRAILARPGAVRLIKTLNEGAVPMAQRQGLAPLWEQPFESVAVDIAAVPDQRFAILPGTDVQALHVPGHTRDFMSYWIASENILIASEAAGCDDGTGYIQPEFLVDYEAYVAGLARLTQLDAEILCPGHKMVLTDEDAREHLRRSAESTTRYLETVQSLLLETRGDFDAVIQRIKELEWDSRPWPKQPEEAYLLNTRQRVTLVWERMQRAN